MAQENFTYEEFERIASDMDRPIPGQSLTDDPYNPAPYERPPEFTSKEEAIEHYLELITNDEYFPDIMKALQEGTEVMTIVELMLTKGFREGEINPDMMLLLAEPLAYILIGLAERQGIRVTIVDDPDDPLEPHQEEDPNIFRKKIRTITKPEDKEELNLDEKIDSAPSLMARGE